MYGTYIVKKPAESDTPQLSETFTQCMLYVTVLKEEEMATSRCEFRLSLIVTLQYLVHTAAAAAGVVHLDPLPDTCVCIINAIDDVVASTRGKLL